MSHAAVASVELVVARILAVWREYFFEFPVKYGETRSVSLPLLL